MSKICEQLISKKEIEALVGSKSLVRIILDDSHLQPVFPVRQGRPSFYNKNEVERVLSQLTQETIK
jgi:hypothetical protein